MGNQIINRNGTWTYARQTAKEWSTTMKLQITFHNFFFIVEYHALIWPIPPSLTGRKRTKRQTYNAGLRNTSRRTNGDTCTKKYSEQDSVPKNT